MMGISYSQLMIVLVVAVVLFGSRLPEVLRQVGRAYAQLRRGLAEFQYTLEDSEPSNGSGRPTQRLTQSNTTRSAVPDDSIDPGEEEFSRSSTPKFSPPPRHDVE